MVENKIKITKLNYLDTACFTLRTFALIVSAHPYCARSFCPVMPMRALSDRADGCCLDLAISDVLWPLFFLLWITFCTDFLRLVKKWRKSMNYKFGFFLQNASSNSVHFKVFVCLCDGEGLSFLNVGKIWNYLRDRPLLKITYMTKTVCLRWLTSDMLKYKIR